jgi:hypothetical protein
MESGRENIYPFPYQAQNSPLNQIIENIFAVWHALFYPPQIRDFSEFQVCKKKPDELS